MEITIQEDDKFVVTGVYYNSNRRFKAIVTESYSYANAINLWRGSLWLLRNGKRTLLKRVFN